MLQSGELSSGRTLSGELTVYAKIAVVTYMKLMAFCFIILKSLFRLNYVEICLNAFTKAILVWTM